MQITVLKQLRNLFLFVSVTLVLWSCGDDDEGSDGPACDAATCIVGTWNVSSQGSSDGTVTFNADGTGISNSETFSASVNDNNSNEEFEWNIEEEELELDFTLEDGGSASITIDVTSSSENRITLFSGLIELTK